MYDIMKRRRYPDSDARYNEILETVACFSIAIERGKVLDGDYFEKSDGTGSKWPCFPYGRP